MVFYKSLTVNLSKKPKKTLSFFSFFKVMTKKNKKTQGKPKKTKHESQTKPFPKSFGFLVFWFSRGFVKKQQKKQQKKIHLNIEKEEENTANSSKL